MNIENFNKEKLKKFVDSEFNQLKKICINNSKLGKKFKGFRLQSISQEVFSYQFLNLVTNTKDKLLIGAVNFTYNHFIDDRKKEMLAKIEEGYSKEMAIAISASGCKSSFVDIYLDDFDLDEVEREKVNLYVEIIKYLSKDFSDNKAFKKELADLDKNNSKNNKEVIDELKILKNNSSKSDEKIQDLLATVDKLIQNITILENDSSKKKDIDSLADNIDKKYNARFDLLNNKLCDKDQINSLNEKIEHLENKLKDIESKAKGGYTIDEIELPEFNVIDDDECFEFDIGDVIMKITKKKEYSLFKSYIEEIFYSEKPIIVSKQNTETLARCLGNLLPVSKVCVFDFFDSNNIYELESDLNKKLEQGKYGVYIFKNVIDVFDYRKILTIINDRNRREKFLFEIENDIEVKFLPDDSLNDFIFFFGKFASNKADSHYGYDLKGKTSQLTDSFKKVLLNLDIKDKNITQYTGDYSGLLAFSILPYLSLRDDIEIEELLLKINQIEIVEKLREYFND